MDSVDDPLQILGRILLGPYDVRYLLQSFSGINPRDPCGIFLVPPRMSSRTFPGISSRASPSNFSTFFFHVLPVFLTESFRGVFPDFFRVSPSDSHRISPRVFPVISLGGSPGISSRTLLIYSSRKICPRYFPGILLDISPGNFQKFLPELFQEFFVEFHCEILPDFFKKIFFIFFLEHIAVLYEFVLIFLQKFLTRRLTDSRISYRFFRSVSWNCPPRFHPKIPLRFLSEIFSGFLLESMVFLYEFHELLLFFS